MLNKSIGIVSIAAKTNRPGKFGNFTILGFDQDTKPIDEVALVKSDILGKENVLVRIQSECVTSHVFG